MKWKSPIDQKASLWFKDLKIFLNLEKLNSTWGGNLENFSMFGALWLIAYLNTDTKTLQGQLIDPPWMHTVISCQHISNNLLYIRFVCSFACSFSDFNHYWILKRSVIQYYSFFFLHFFFFSSCTYIQSRSQAVCVKCLNKLFWFI